MPRRRRAATAGLTFHVLNRSAKRVPLFESDDDFALFERIVARTLGKHDVALHAYCLMPNHWHMVLSPGADGELSRLMHRLTTTHARRWHLARGLDGQGAVYQGRFRAIPVGADRHFLWVCRYVERNALRASLVSRAEDWPWSSLGRRRRDPGTAWLASWPVPRPIGWTTYVNEPQTDAELRTFRRAVVNDEPFGDEGWREAVQARLGLAPRRRSGADARAIRVGRSAATPDPITNT
jgi:putative transposase